MKYCRKDEKSFLIGNRLGGQAHGIASYSFQGIGIRVQAPYFPMVAYDGQQVLNLSRFGIVAKTKSCDNEAADQ